MLMQMCRTKVRMKDHEKSGKYDPPKEVNKATITDPKEMEINKWSKNSE